MKDEEKKWREWKEEQDRLLYEAQERLKRVREREGLENLIKRKKPIRIEKSNNNNNIQKVTEVVEEKLEPIDREIIVIDSNSTDFDASKFLEEIENNYDDSVYEYTNTDFEENMKYDNVKKHEEKSNTENFKTRETREKERISKLKKYKKVYIRIKFPDNIMMQGCFHPLENIKSLYEFVKCNLNDQNHDFYLYITPPRVVLNHEDVAPFRDIGFIPATLVYFGTKDLREHYLKPDLLSNILTTAPSYHSIDPNISINNVNQMTINIPNNTNQKKSTGDKKGGGAPAWLKLKK